jgi:pullulanase/glycogen debranching enzyme
MTTSVFDPAIQHELNQPRLPIPGKKMTPSPEDWRDQWIYFLMVDRFNNPSSPPKTAYDAKYGGFQGGTIAGIRQQLPYLKELGVGAIWFTPVLKNCQALNGQNNEGSYHGYGIQDFLQLDPRFCSDPDQADAELQALIDDAHEEGIYVIFDIVLNHTGDVFAYGANSPHSTGATLSIRRSSKSRACGKSNPHCATADFISARSLVTDFILASPPSTAAYWLSRASLTIRKLWWS